MVPELTKEQRIANLEKAKQMRKERTELRSQLASGVLEDVLGAKVVAASIDGEALNPAIPDLEAMGFLDLLRAWRRARKRKGKQ